MICSHEDWLKEYRKDRYRTWVKVTLSNNETRYFCDYKEWQKVKELCKKQHLNVVEIGLQRKTNYVGVDTKGCSGVYLVRSVLGLMGQDAISTYTIGKIVGNKVKKQVFLIPELTEHRKEEDDITSCFEEALLYHHYDPSKTKAI
jgi:hypothetical protein